MFKELYYWMYTRLNNIKSNDAPALNAHFLIGILQFFNIGTLFVIINYFAKIDIGKKAILPLGLSFAFITSVINYFSLYKNSEEIFKKYESLSPARKSKGLFYFWLYVLLSTIIFWVAVANLVTPKY